MHPLALSPLNGNAFTSGELLPQVAVEHDPSRARTWSCLRSHPGCGGSLFLSTQPLLWIATAAVTASASLVTDTDSDADDMHASFGPLVTRRRRAFRTFDRSPVDLG